MSTETAVLEPTAHPRRGYGEGSHPARKRRLQYGDGRIVLKGRIWHVVTCDGHGHRRYESSGSEDWRVAEKLRKQRAAEKRLGLLPDPRHERTTFDEIAADVLAEYDALRRRTLRDARIRIEKHLKKFFGGMRAKDITNELAQDYLLRRRGEGAVDGTIWQELALLRHALRLAVKNKKLREAPGIEFPRLENVRTGFLEPEKYAALKDALPDYLKPVFAMGWYTGMRRGEIVGLKWSRVRLGDRPPNVRLHPHETKTKKGRVIPLSGELVKILAGLGEKHAKKCEEYPGCEHRVFTRGGNPIGSFRKAWDTACKQAGVPGLLFHDLRRSAVRNMVRAGMPESVAMKISGHRTRSIFERYNIVSEHDLARAMRSLEAYLAERSATHELARPAAEIRALPQATAAD